MERFSMWPPLPDLHAASKKTGDGLSPFIPSPLGEAAFTIARMPALIASGRSNQTATLALLAVRKCLVYACLKLLCPRV